MKNHFLLLSLLFISLITHAQITKTINVTTAGTLTTLLTTEEKSTLTQLNVTGSIDASDFKCLRDEMPLLSVIDLHLVSILAYTGTSGTSTTSTVYNQNEIPPYAFYNLTTKTSKSALIYILLPNTLSSIGTYAFYGCTSLTGISLPITMKSISAYAFGNCSALQSFSIDPSNTNLTVVDGVLFDKTITTLVQFPPAKSGVYTVPSTVTKIGDYSFYTCNLLSNISLPDQLSTIGNVAFGACTGLTNLVVPNNVSSIGIYAFFACNKLTSINIPNSIVTLGSYAFLNCTALSAFVVDASNPIYSALDGVLFNKDQTVIKIFPLGKLGAYKIPNTVTSIGSEAFYQNITLTAIDIPSSVTSIAGYAFTGCSNLTEFTVEASNPNFTAVNGVLFNKDLSSLLSYPAGKSGAYVIPSSTTSLGIGAFSSCAKLTGITIPVSMNSIGDNAFYQCSGLTSINIPSTVTTIGNAAFSGCTALKSLTANAVTPISFSLTSEVFSFINKDSCTLYVPNGLTSSYKTANQWKNFANIVGPGSTGISTNNVLSINLYPTLATEYFTVNGLDAQANLTLLNLEGKIIFTKLVHNADQISVSELPQGIYIARIYTSSGSVEKKVIKQ
jgi:hypothetical protein